MASREPALILDQFMCRYYDIPMKKRSAIKPPQLRETGISRAKIDQPVEHAVRYFAEGSRWTRYVDGHMPTIDCFLNTIHRSWLENSPQSTR